MARTTINSLGVPAGTITAADLTFPLTDFSSTGIDDNASSTAMTIASSGETTFTGDIVISEATPAITLDDADNADGELKIVQSAGSSFYRSRGVSGNGVHVFQRNDGTTNLKVFQTNSIGDVLFYDNDGATEGMRWDASASKLTNFTSTGIDDNASSTSLTIDSSGNIAVTGTVDGRDLATDGAKLDGIEANADVTDTTNVTAAGALMDSELTDLAGVKGVTISTLQPKPSEGAFADGDKTKLDGIATGADVTPSWVPSSDPSYLTSFDITTQTDSKYLRSNTSDTMVGDLTISTTSAVPLILKDSDATGNSAAIYMEYHDQTNTRVGYVGMGSGSNGDNYLFSTNGSPHLYSGNSSAPKYNNNTIWHAGNDGSGSGLDADTVDGIQGSNLLTLSGSQTVTGLKTFSSAGGNVLLLNDTNATNATNANIYFYFQAQGSNLGYIGYGSGSTNYLYINNPSAPVYLAGSSVLLRGGYEAWGTDNDGSGSGLDADTVDGIQAASFLRSDTSDTITGGATLNFNTSGGSTRGYLQATDTNDQHFIVATSGGEDIAFKDGGTTGATNFIMRGDGQCLSRGGLMNLESISVNKSFGYGFSSSVDPAGGYGLFRQAGAWSSPFPDIILQGHTGIQLNANPSYDGVRCFADYNSSTRIIQINGASNYIYKDVWLHTDSGEGMYSSANSAHIYPNTNSTYAPWAINGSKGSYGGLYDAYGGHAMMWDSSGNGGDYREANGRWIYYHLVSNSCTGFNTSTTSSAYTIYVSGAIYATSNITAYSDRRVKENIIQIDSALDKVNKLEGVYYNKIDDETKTREIGFIAQDVQEAVPELVTYAEDIDEYGVKYGNATALLVEAVKELTQKVKELEKKLEEK